jgi:hypothetical protein
MSTDQSTPVWGQTNTPNLPTPPPSASRKPSRLVTIVIAVVAAVVLVGGGIAVAKAVDSGSSTGTNQGSPGNGGFGGPAGGPGGGQFGGRGDGLSDALHGDFVASDGNGGYVTKRLQSGTVTAVSSTSITAKSADGHTTTFVISSSTSVDNGVDTISSVKAGDTVTVVGTVSGSSATATSILDSTLNQANGNQQGGPPNQNGTGS